MAAQAQKHVTHNDALRLLDTLVNLHVLEMSRNDPPATPAEGDCYILGDTPTGDWSNHANAVAAFIDGAWIYATPFRGLRAFDGNTGALMHHDGTIWTAVPGGGSGQNPQSLPMLGINTAADNTNLLAVKSDGVLFSTNDQLSAPTGDIRVTVNKTATGDTGTFVFQTGYSGRAEMGISGSDDFSFKVSPDGQNWKTALAIDGTTGAVTMPFTSSGSSGSLSNTSLVNLFSDGGRFAGAPEPLVTTSAAFQLPNWMRVLNGATVTEHAKFHRNSSTYGGTQPALDADLKQLHEQLLDSNLWRYFPEYYVAKITAGSGTSSSRTFSDNIVRYTQVFTQSFMRPVFATFSYYLKSLSGGTGLYSASETDIFVDGVLQGGNPVVPADGNWHHIVVKEGFPIQESYRYSYNSIRTYLRDTEEALLAFPALMAGDESPPQNLGHLPSATNW